MLEVRYHPHTVAQCDITNINELFIFFLIAEQCLDELDVEHNSVCLLMEDDIEFVKSTLQIRDKKVEYTRRWKERLLKQQSIHCRVSIVRDF